MSRVVPTHSHCTQDLGLGPIEPCDVPTALLPFCTSQIGVTRKLLRVQLPTACHNEGMKQYDSSRDTTPYCFHLDIKPLTTTLWRQPSRQFFIHQRVYPSNFLHSNLTVRILRGDTKSKALQNPRQMTSLPLPLSTDTVTPS